MWTRHHPIRTIIIALIILAVCAAPALKAQAAQAQDKDYTAKILEYTTEKFFLTEFVDHLPASDTVPTPLKVLGHIVGAPDVLDHSADIYKYLRALDAATPRVQVFSDRPDRRRPRDDRASPSPPRRTSPAWPASRRSCPAWPTPAASRTRTPPSSSPRASRLLDHRRPPFQECGSPEMMMELAYRLAVEDTDAVRAIRKNMVVLMTPILEVDGWDKAVDSYLYKKDNKDKKTIPPSTGGNTSSTTITATPSAWGSSSPRTSSRPISSGTRSSCTTSTSPCPISTSRRGRARTTPGSTRSPSMSGRSSPTTRSASMNRRGVPGVWTHGFFDGWARELRLLRRPFPQLRRPLLRDLRRDRSGHDGPDRRRRIQAGLVPAQPSPRVGQVVLPQQHRTSCRAPSSCPSSTSRRTRTSSSITSISRASAPWPRRGPKAPRPTSSPRIRSAPWPPPGSSTCSGRTASRSTPPTAEITVGKDKYPAGSYVVRMDQPYSRCADMLLDTQYYNPKDPRPYDDTGWTLGPLFNVRTVRVTDAKVLDAAMTRPQEGRGRRGKVVGKREGRRPSPSTTRAEPELMTFRYRLKDVKMLAAEDGFTQGDVEVQRRNLHHPQGREPGRPRGPAGQGLRRPRALTATGSRRKPRRQDPRPRRAAAGHPPFLAEHPGRGLVPAGLRQAGDSLRLHPPPGDPGHGGPQAQIRRHHLPAGRHVRARPRRVVNGIGGEEPIPYKKTEKYPNLGDARFARRHPRRNGAQGDRPPQVVHRAGRAVRPDHGHGRAPDQLRHRGERRRGRARRNSRPPGSVLSANVTDTPEPHRLRL